MKTEGLLQTPVTAAPGEESRSRSRVGGHLVAESLHALGADVAFGLPGQHALGVFDGLIHSDVRFVGSRTEVAASFAAHGYAAAGGSPAPLLLSTGPGALMSLAGLQEAEMSGTPVVCICSQIPREGFGRNRGFVHELRSQIDHFRPLVKGAHTVLSAEMIPEVLAMAWRQAQSPPSGPVFVEIPVDVLGGPTTVPPVEDLDGEAFPLPPRPELIARAARSIENATRVSILAGGGVLRAGAWDELRELAERLGAPVVMSYGGKSAFPDDHPLCAGSACERPEVMDLVGSAEVTIVIGSSLSEDTTNHYTLDVRGKLIQVEADPTRLANYGETDAILGDAKLTLRALLDQLGERAPDETGPERARQVREAVDRAFQAEGREAECDLLGEIGRALPAGAVTAWDMTILSYWASMAFPVERPRHYLFPQGSGTLGYGYPAALGAKVALPANPVLAICGDGGILYALGEIASALDNNLDSKLLVVDDGGYGVLREYQRERFGRTFATDLTRPSFESAFEAFRIPARTIDSNALSSGVEWLFETSGPAALVLEADPVMFGPAYTTAD